MCWWIFSYFFIVCFYIVENEYFEIGNLIISSHFHSNHRGIVNLTWEVPLHMVHQIASFDVQYVEAGNDNWQRVVFHGTRPSALLHNLKSDTEYILKIKTTLTNNVQTESGDFRFKTPKEVAHIYSSHVKTDLIAGYDVYVSDDKDRPDSQWKLTQLNGREASLALDGLRGSTEYFVRVNVRNKDGSIIRAPSIYRFKTIDKKGSNTERREGNSLSYRNIGPGQVEISWTYPSSVLDNVAGATIFYIDAEEASSEHWQKIFIDNPTETTVLLSQLKQGTRYSVQIIPRLRNGNFDYLSASTFELKTDTFATTASDAIISTEINNPESIIGDVRHNEKTPKIRKKHMLLLLSVSTEPYIFSIIFC
ncbi:fibronectin type III domain protein [Dictyocaulus viviparus]|uniref:Fibronectin type III domain protein n=1 Tax=Dictyocaulus viviparus TaxID=29172 RepID=A0A0D8X793_DICVI|nr:fibronectin type III domain protein [Dictyocaulus viviparus]